MTTLVELDERMERLEIERLNAELADSWEQPTTCAFTGALLFTGPVKTHPLQPERWLVGEPGSGKSVACMTVMGLVWGARLRHHTPHDAHTAWDHDQQRAA